MDLTRVEETIELILREYCGSQEKAVSHEMDVMEDLGLDSMEWMSFLMDIETQFEVEIPDEYFFSDTLTKLGNIISAVKSLIPGSEE